MLTGAAVFRSRLSLLFCSLTSLACLGVAAQTPLEEAKKIFAAADFAKAAGMLRGIRGGTDGCEAEYYLGLSLLRLRQLDEAIVALRSAAVCGPSDVAANMALAEAWLAKGDENRAAALLEAVVAKEPANVAALRSLASIYLRHELNDKAVETLQRLIKIRPEDAQTRADLGAALAGTLDFVKAQEQFEQALRLDPTQAGAMVGLANVYLKTDQTDAAQPLLDRAIGIDPKAFEAHFLRGLTLYKLQRPQEAAGEYEAALRLGGDDPDIFYQLARAYRALGKEAESKEALSRFSAIRTKVQNEDERKREAARLILEATPLVQKGSLPEAVELVRKASVLDPGNAELWFRLGGLQYDLKQLPGAKASVARAIEIAPSQWTFHYLLGLIETGMGSLEAASASLNTALRLNPSTAEVINALGNVSMRKQDYSEAFRHFEHASALESAQPAYRLNMDAARELRDKRR